MLVRRSSQNQKRKPRVFPNPGCVFLGVFPDDSSGEAKDCISQAKRMDKRMTATGKERSFYLVVLDAGAQQQ
jgi:hypothetical protein